MKPTPAELNEILRLHALYLKGDEQGKQADLSFANLSFADLSFANLSNANLRSANLSSAILSFANLSFADLSFADLSNANLRSANLSNANLSNANLRSANLSFADLRSDNLRSAKLSNANLSFARGIQYAQCSFTGHGELGRTLTLVKIVEDLIFFCGCFKGSPLELKEYIEKGKPELAASRNLAMNFCLSAIEMKSNIV